MERFSRLVCSSLVVPTWLYNIPSLFFSVVLLYNQDIYSQLAPLCPHRIYSLSWNHKIP